MSCVLIQAFNRILGNVWYPVFTIFLKNMIKELITSALLTVAPIQNTVIPVKAVINCNEGITKYTQDYSELLRRNQISTGLGIIETIQYECYEVEDNEVDKYIRNTYTIIKVQATNTVTNLDEAIIGQWQTDDGNYETNNYIGFGYYLGTYATFDTLFNYSDLTLWENRNTLNTKVNQFITAHRYGEEQSYTSDESQDVLKEKFVATQAPATYYYAMNYQIQSRASYNRPFINSQELRNGIIKTTLDIDYQVNIDNTGYEVIDIPNVMFSVLGLPFTFISTAFNFTFFAGTPYAINVSNILFTIIGALLVVIVVRKVLR